MQATTAIDARVSLVHLGRCSGFTVHIRYEKMMYQSNGSSGEPRSPAVISGATYCLVQYLKKVVEEMHASKSPIAGRL